MQLVTKVLIETVGHIDTGRERNSTEGPLESCVNKQQSHNKEARASGIVKKLMEYTEHRRKGVVQAGEREHS